MLKENRTSVASTIRPQAATATVTGETVDLAGYDAATVVLDVGAWTDGTHTFSVEEAEDDGAGSPDTWAAVADADLDGTEPVVDGAADDDTIVAIGYWGTARFLRVVNTVTAAPATGLVFAATVIRGAPRRLS
jgi:hypothetical protein